jgi:hypothetical protein
MGLSSNTTSAPGGRTHADHLGADYEQIDERAALWCAKDDAQWQGKARAR